MGVDCEQRPALSQKLKKKENNTTEDITPICLDTSQSLSESNPTLLLYIHVNMAEVSAMFLLSIRGIESGTLRGWMQWQISSGDGGTAAQQQGMSDSVAAAIKYSLHSRPSTPELTSSS